MATRQRKTNFALEQREQTTSGALAAEGRAARGTVVMNSTKHSERGAECCAFARSAIATNRTFGCGRSGSSVFLKRTHLRAASRQKELALALTKADAPNETALNDRELAGLEALVFGT
jgi:hypothetical protein